MINRAFRWIASHQVASFFIITFLITWGLGFSYNAVSNEKYFYLPLMFLATCGPALAGIIVTCIAGTNRTPAKKTTVMARLLNLMDSCYTCLYCKSIFRQ